MAIELLPTDTATTSYSDGDFSKPLCFTFDGILGGVQEKKMYLKNTSTSSVTVDVEVTGINQSAPYNIYLKSSTTNAEWTTTTPKLTDVSIPANSGMNYFFIKMEISSDSPVNSYNELRLSVEEQ